MILAMPMQINSCVSFVKWQDKKKQREAEVKSGKSTMRTSFNRQEERRARRVLTLQFEPSPCNAYLQPGTPAPCLVLVLKTFLDRLTLPQMVFVHSLAFNLKFQPETLCMSRNLAALNPEFCKILLCSWSIRPFWAPDIVRADWNGHLLGQLVAWLPVRYKTS